MPDNENVNFVGQMVGLKNLKAEGGWRLTVDIFDSRIQARPCPLRPCAVGGVCLIGS